MVRRDGGGTQPAPNLFPRFRQMSQSTTASVAMARAPALA
ncbi:hypothetical protein RSAG8_03272, partial [Rhizoctonia solani AG-8 WAC10335]